MELIHSDCVLENHCGVGKEREEEEEENELMLENQLVLDQYIDPCGSC